MIMAQALLKTYRQSPRKVRLVADLVRGVSVEEALNRLRFSDKRAAEQVAKVIVSALANAKDIGQDRSELRVAEIRVDEGPTLQRSRPRAQGRAFPIRKRTSHIFVRLESLDSPEYTQATEVVETDTAKTKVKSRSKVEVKTKA